MSALEDMQAEETVSGEHPPDDDAVLVPVPDLRGLPVEDASGIGVGVLFGALAEVETGLVRYFDLDLASKDRHVLIPIGHARVREDDEHAPRVRLRAALLEELEQIPPFPADVAHINDPFERALLEAYGRTFHGERYYAHPSYDHSGLFAGDHLVADGSLEAAEGPLRRLAYMPGWRIADSAQDVRGWTLQLDGGTEAEVDDVIVDVGAGKVRYVVVSLPDSPSPRLIPVGFVQLMQEDRRVCAPGLLVDDIKALPPYDGGGVTRDQEERMHAMLRRQLRGRRRYMLPDFRGGGG